MYLYLSPSDFGNDMVLSHVQGHQVGLLQLIFRIVPTNRSSFPDRFLTYIQRFDIIPQVNPEFSASRTARGAYPERGTSMYVLKRATRADRTSIGGIIPLRQIRGLVNLVPRFGDKAERRLTKENCLAYSGEFWLNKYFDKEIFYALDSTQH